MAYLTKEELKTHAKQSEITAIIEGDETIALACIDIAIEFATSKLLKQYDTDLIFSKTGTDRNPLLLKIVKDIAIWELIGLGNPSIDYDDKKFRYQQAVDWLEAVYGGMKTTLDKIQVTEEEEVKTTSFTYHSNPKRQNHY
ncbi:MULTISPECIES: phage protein Gp36 family protein [Tenacibaculum]|uniref:phage protein Gp36 family protein n=1 Tax=Tenacibaculum TaxID=104267 RepID=UPI00064A3F0F|nr:phage protein Gp36 family protein [Tenacibaculum mesophilum]